MPFSVCPSTKMPILCSGMVAASLAAPIGAQHYPPRALRGASGSSAPGNKLPQPTTQPAAVHAAGNCPPCNLPPWRYSRGTTAKSYRRHACRRACCRNLPPCMLPQPAAKTYLPLILPCIPRTTYLPGTLPTAKTYPPGHTTLLWVPRPAGG